MTIKYVHYFYSDYFTGLMLNINKKLKHIKNKLFVQVFKHDIGEIWHLRCSPHDVATLLTTHNTYDPETSQCTMGVSIYKLPTVEVCYILLFRQRLKNIRVDMQNISFIYNLELLIKTENLEI